MAVRVRRWRRVENPILTKELRTRMRGSRAYWILFAYLGSLSLILFVTYLSWWNTQQSAYYSGYDGSNAFTIGKIFYQVLFTVQALLVGLITPALTSGAISIEKEQRTMEMLSVSLLPRRSIVVGKLVSAVAFVGLLLTSSLPLVSLTFLLGGVSPGEVATAYILLMMTAFLYGSVGVMSSSLAKNTTSATVQTYGLIVLLFFLILPLVFTNAGGFMAGGSSASGTGSGVLSALNPLGAVSVGTDWETYCGVLHLPAWFTALLVNGLLGTIFTLTAIHRLDYPRTDRSALLRGVVALLVGVLALFFYGGNWPNDKDFADLLGVVTVLAPCLLVPIFATGEGLPGGLRGAFQLRRGQPVSGVTYTILLTLLVWGICQVTLPVMAHKQALISGGAASYLNPLAVFSTTLAVMWGCGAMGLLFSAITRNRWAASALTFTTMLLLYLALLALGLMGNPEEATARVNFAYLSPLVAALDAPNGELLHSEPGKFFFFGQTTPLWIVTTVLYAVIGALCLTGTGFVLRRQARRAALAAAADTAKKEATAPTPA